jgi:Ca-activated chloride channel family protein
VTLSAVVRDSHGQLVKNLTAADFELLDAGEARPILEFRSEPAPAGLGLLLDASGSMAVGAKAARARLAAQQLSSWLKPGTDEAAVFAFDTEFRELRSFSTDVLLTARALDEAAPFGATSLWDGIATAARRIVQQAHQRRALVVLTDGLDTSSRYGSADVSAIANAIDVPVYIIAVASPLGEEHRRQLTALARSTGGDLHVVTGPATASIAARQIVEELRHQYFIALEASATPGWHPLAVRTRDSDLKIRARSGYFVEP